MENGKFCFGHRTTEGKDQKILSDKGFDVGKWYNVNYTFKRLSEPTDDEISAKSYSGYICALYVDGELVDEFCHGIFTDWKITRTGRFTSHASYSQLGLRPYSKALVTIDIDNLTQYMCLGTEELKPEPDPEPDPDPEPEPDPEPDVPGVLEGSVDFGFEFNGEGWNTNLYNIITNGGFEEEDENGWKRGTTDMADVGYTTEKAYAGERSSYMFFPDVFPEGSKNTDNAYGAFRDYNVYSINPFSTYDISMAVIAEGISSDSRHNAQLSFRTSSASNGNKAVQGEEGGFCKITEDVSDWTVVRGRYTPSKEEEKYVTQLCTRMRGTNSTKGWFDEMYFGTMQRVVKESENGMSDSAFEGNGLMQIGAYNEMHGTESVYSDTLDCTANKTYLFTVYNKVDSDKANAYTAVEFLDENGNVISTVKSDSNTQTSWVKSELYATAPEGAAKLRMVLCASGSGLASFDSASLEEQTSVATSFVGIVPGKIGMPKNSEKKVELSGSVLDQFGAPMNSEISYKLASPVEGVSISGNIITITDRVEKGSIIKVTASADDLSETFEWYVESIRTFVINGADEIERDSKALEETYKAVLTNSEGTKTVLSPSETEWSVKNKKDGISIDSEGVLTVSKNAPVGTYTVIAKWLSDPEYVAEFDVKITRAPSGGSSGGFGGGFSGGSSFVPVNPAAPSQNPNPESQTQLPEASDKLYSDLDETHWAYNQIEEFTSKGIVTGKGNETFDPEGNVTRAEFVKMLVLSLNIYDSASESQFADCRGKWYDSYVASAVNQGIVTGISDDIFNGDAIVTRQDMATMTYRAVMSRGIDLKQVNYNIDIVDEASIDGYAKTAVTSMWKAGILNGMGDGYFAPHSSCNRAMSAKVISHIMAIKAEGGTNE